MEDVLYSSTTMRSDNSSSLSLSVVVPVYKAAGHIQQLHERLIRVLWSLCERWNIIYVDDHSPDDSFSLLTRFAEECSRVVAVRLKENRGQQHATFCGLGFAIYDYIVTIDDDLQYDPEDISRLLQCIVEYDLDCVYGIPEVRNRHIHRKLGTRMIDRCIRYITGKPKSIGISSFRIMTQELARQITTSRTSYIYLSVEIFSRTYRVGNIGIGLTDIKRQTRYTIRKLMKVYFSILLYYSIFGKKVFPARPLYTIDVVVGGVPVNYEMVK